MKVVAGIAYDDGRFLISFESSRRRQTLFSVVFSCRISSEASNFFSLLEENINEIDRCITNMENKYSCRALDVYVCLPAECVQKISAEDVVVLDIKRGKRKLSAKDFLYAKKHIENVVLGWDDVVLHHLIQECEVEGEKYSVFPVDTWANKIKLKSLLITVKNRVYEKVSNMFENTGRYFSGFVYEPLAEYACFASGYEESKINFVIVHIRNSHTQVSFFSSRRLVSEINLPVGEKDIIKSIMDKFIVGKEVAAHMLFHYGSLDRTVSSKDVSVRSRGGYINVGLASLNALIRVSLNDVLSSVTGCIRDNGGEPALVSFLGKITDIAGFYKFVQEVFSFKVSLPFQREGVPVSSGCIRYGLYRFLEALPRRENLIQKAIRVYREYF